MYLYLLCHYCIVFYCQLSFFFFKQKTAYDMRISDWSSDVCSSDLRNGGDGLPPPSQPFLDGIEPDLPATEQQNLDPAMQEELSQLVIGLGNRQIGRASCRERVCQYV